MKGRNYLVLASQQPSLNSRGLPSRFIWDFLNNFSSSTLSSLCRKNTSSVYCGSIVALWLFLFLLVVFVKERRGGPFEYYTFKTSMLICDLKHQNQNVLFPFPKRFPHSFFVLLLVGVLFIFSCLRFPSFQMSVPLALCSFHLIFPIHLLQKGRPRRPTQRHDTTQPATHRANFLLQDPTYVHVSWLLFGPRVRLRGGYWICISNFIPTSIQPWKILLFISSGILFHRLAD